MISRAILFLSLIISASVFAVDIGQYELRKRAADGMISHGLTLANGQAIGQLGGVPAALNVQAYDADLAAIAVLTTTGYGRELLTLANAAALRSYASLIPGVDVQGYDDDLAGIAALTTTGYGRGLLTLANAASVRATLELGTLATQSANIADYLTISAAGSAYQPLDVDLTNIAAVTTTSYGRSVLATADASALRTLAGVDLSLYQSKAGVLDLGAFSSITGTPRFQNSLIVDRTGYTQGAGLLTAVDDNYGPSNALYILSPSSGDRVFIGSNAVRVGNLNLQYVGAIEGMPATAFPNFFKVGGTDNCYIARGAGGTEIGANHSSGYGLDIFQDDSFAVATLAHRALNVHRDKGLTYFGSSTSRTNYEGVNLGVTSSVYHLWTTKGSAGGTARPLVLGYDSTEKMRISSEGLSIGGGTPVAALLSATASIDFAETEAGGGNSSLLVLTGARVGDTVLLMVPLESRTTKGIFEAHVTDVDLITVTFANFASSAADPGEGDFTVTIIQY